MKEIKGPTLLRMVSVDMFYYTKLVVSGNKWLNLLLLIPGTMGE